MNLYYLGPEETFSHRAATHMAQAGEVPVPCSSFREVFRRTAADPGSTAVVPFENTAQGPVTEVMDLLAKFPTLEAVLCRAVPVHHHLLARDLTTPLTRILSKAEALAQCRETLGKTFPGVPLVPVSSTAEAARLASEDPTLGAVAGETTAKRYGLTVRQTDVQDVQGNTTRFFRLETRPNEGHGHATTLPPTHALLYATLDDRPGALRGLLEPLAGIDLSFIQSRPIPGEKWKYAFYLELFIGTAGVPLATILESLTPMTRELRVLGTYSITTQPSLQENASMTSLSSLRAMIADIDSTLMKAFVARHAFRHNPELYVHAEPVSGDAVARAFATGDGPTQAVALRHFYVTQLLTQITEEGTDANPRPALHADTEVLSALDRRLRFATKVIARKRIELAPELRKAAASGDPAQVEQALLNVAVEDQVLARTHDFALREGLNEAQAQKAVAFYRDVLLPLSRKIQVHIILSQP